MCYSIRRLVYKGGYISYLDSGFDENLNRELPDIRTQYLEADASYLFPQISGSQIGGGITTSADGKIIINWDTGEVIFSDGGRGRVFLGKIQGSDEYGIKIVDASGNIVMSSTGKIQADGLEDGSVTTTKIANLAVTNAKIANLAVTNAKIDSLSADKITAGILDVAVDIGESGSVGRIRLDGVNNRMTVRADTGLDQVLVGEHPGGF